MRFDLVFSIYSTATNFCVVQKWHFLLISVLELVLRLFAVYLSFLPWGMYWYHPSQCLAQCLYQESAQALHWTVTSLSAIPFDHSFCIICFFKIFPQAFIIVHLSLCSSSYLPWQYLQSRKCPVWSILVSLLPIWCNEVWPCLHGIASLLICGIHTGHVLVFDRWLFFPRVNIHYILFTELRFFCRSSSYLQNLSSEFCPDSTCFSPEKLQAYCVK